MDNKKIYIIARDYFFSDLLIHRLEHEGFRCGESSESIQDFILKAGEIESANSLIITDPVEYKEVFPNIKDVVSTLSGMGRVICFSRENCEYFCVDMLRAGARGFIYKNSKFDELKKAVRTVFNNRIYISNSIYSCIIDNFLLNDYGNNLKTINDQQQEIEKFKTLLDISPVLVTIHSGSDEYLIEYVNANFLSYSGYSYNEIIHVKSFFDFVFEFSRNQVLAGFKRVLSDKSARHKMNAIMIFHGKQIKVEIHSVCSVYCGSEKIMSVIADKTAEFKTGLSTQKLLINLLSKREKTWFYLNLAGCSSKQIGRYMKSEQGTISTYKKRIINKFTAAGFDYNEVINNIKEMLDRPEIEN